MVATVYIYYCGANSMADPGWGIWDKCPPPTEEEPAILLVNTKAKISFYETHEDMHILIAFITKKIKLTEIVNEHIRAYQAPLKIIIVLMLFRHSEPFTASQPSANAKMSKINCETLLRGDYLLLQKYSN